MQIGPYEVAGELGRGAMGVVLQGYDYAIGRPVAIKVIRSHEFASAEEQANASMRFRREAAAAGRLSHPGIITIYQFGEDQGHGYLAMEFVQGSSLEQLLASGTPPPLPNLLDMLRQVADALDYAHSQGVIHRDVKPGNILVRPDGKIKITDFGIARIVSQTLTHASMTMGTVAYMSPEQLQGSRVDGRADQYSLAAMIFKVLTGRQVFDSESFLGLSYKIVHEEPVAASKLNPRLTAPTDRVLARALAKSPDARYATCTLFIAELERALLGTGSRAAAGPLMPLNPPRSVPTPVPTVPIIAPWQAPVPKRRSNGIWIAIASVGACVVIGLAIAWLVWWRQPARPCSKQPFGCYYEDAMAKRGAGQAAEALTLFQRAADAGDPRGMVETGEACQLGRGTAIDFSSAARWYRKAADAGNGDGMALLGDMYDGAHGLPRNADEAVRWYRRAVDANSGLGMNNLGLAYETAFGVPLDYPEALSWYHKSSDAGCGAGMANLGSMYANAHGVTRDDAQAVVWFRKAVEKDDGEGLNWLGSMYAEGRGGLAKNVGEALRLYRKAAAIPYPEAFVSLGTMYISGTGVAKDDAEALRQYRKAVDLGSASGMYHIGAVYRNGRGVKQDDAEAVRWFRKAAEAGDFQGMDLTGWMYEKGYGVAADATEAVRWYRMAADAGHPESIYDLGRMYEAGTGVPKDVNEAIRLYQRAAALGVKEAGDRLEKIRTAP
jgi:TPR repeat protein/tRNA A-37 threonylcarbamoyl transferase component Bud32